MGLKLNAIKDTYVVEQLGRLLSGRETRAARFPDSREETHLHIMGRIGFELGAGHYQQEGDLHVIRSRFAEAADWWLRMLENRAAVPPGGAASYLPRPSLRALSIAVTFGTLADRDRTCRLQLDQLCTWGPPQAGVQDPEPVRAPWRNALRLLLDYLREGVIDRVDAQRQLESLSAPSADRVHVEWVKPLVEGLIALTDNDADRLTAAVKALEKVHAREAKRGEYKQLFDGFVCESALMLVKLGREKGLTVNIDSLYVPVQLLPEA